MKNFFLALLLFSQLNAESWEKVETIPARTLNFIYNNGDILYTASDSLMYVSRDNGITWSELSPEAPAGIEALIEIDNVLYAGTYGRGVYKSVDQGKSWQQFNEGLAGWGLYAIKFYRMNNRLYLGTDGGGVYYLDLTNAEKWIEYNQNLPSLTAWSIICMSGINNRLIISSGANGFIHFRDEGSAGWTENYVDPLKKFQPWSLLTFGNYVFAGTIRGIYRSADNGASWDSVGIRALPLRTKFLQASGNTILAGMVREYDFFIWSSADSGITWQSVDHQFFSIMDFLSTEDHFFAACQDGLWRFRKIPVSVSSVKEETYPELFSVYPNPFNPMTNIVFTLPQDGFVLFSIYDMKGKEAASIFRGEMKKGKYTYQFDGNDFSTGIYLCSMIFNGKTYSKKLLLLR